MIFYILISVVFVAELIIAWTIITQLLKLDKIFCKYSSVVTEIRPKIKEVAQLCTKISEQMIELAPIFVNSIKSVIKKIALKNFENICAAIIIWIIKCKLKQKS